MVEVGKLTIMGDIDTSKVERGFNRMRQGMDDIKADAESSQSSFSGLATAAGSLAGSLTTIATAGVSGMAGLAAMGPAVGPALSKISMEFKDITHTLSRFFRPAFEAVANKLLPAVNQMLDKAGPQLREFANIASEGIGDLSKAITGEWNSIKDLVPKGGGAAIGAAAGYAVGGPIGMFVGASLGYAAGNLLGKGISQTQEYKDVVKAQQRESQQAALPGGIPGITKPFTVDGEIPSGGITVGSLSRMPDKISAFWKGMGNAFDILMGESDKKTIRNSSPNKSGN